jgi:hypothetical protein
MEQERQFGLDIHKDLVVATAVDAQGNSVDHSRMLSTYTEPIAG